ASASLTRRAPVAVAPEDEGLWYALRACRKRLAEEHGVPPYVIFHDSTLREMLEQRPLTSSEMLSISGVGDSKLERFGDEFLEVKRGYYYASSVGSGQPLYSCSSRPLDPFTRLDKGPDFSPSAVATWSRRHCCIRLSAAANPLKPRLSAGGCDTGWFY